MPMKNLKLPGSSSRMNSGKPSSVPTVPGAFGDRPLPSPWATRRISRFISAVFEEDFPVFPEIINAGCGGQRDGCPLGDFCHPPCPGVSGNRKAEETANNAGIGALTLEKFLSDRIMILLPSFICDFTS